MLKTGGGSVLQCDESDEIVEDKSEERDHEEKVDDEPGYQPRPRVLPYCEDEDELSEKEGREEEDEIIAETVIEVLLQELSLAQHVRVAVEESQADDEGEVHQAPENAGYLQGQSQLYEAERCHHSLSAASL